tara:strand:- start:45 stop:683 length:639 start_codon:yes stop_codon:yes gene_type:complete
MYALITDGSITKHLSGNRGLTIGAIQYPRDIFSKWTEAQRNAIGIFEVIQNNAKKKDEAYYINTNQTFTYDADAGTVTATYGDATAKAHADTLWTQADSDNGLLPSDKSVGDVKVEGLKTIRIREVKAQAAGILQDTDWYIVRKADAGTAVPSAITNHRAAVRTKCAEMETAITNASDTPAIETLYTYVNTADEGDPVVMERPLGEFPVLGS